MPKGVVIYPSYYEAIKDLPDDDRVKVYDSIMVYGLYGEIRDLPAHLNGFFVLMQPTIDSSRKRYDTACKNGRKGGRPPKNQSKNQEYENDEESDIDWERDYEKEEEEKCEKKWGWEELEGVGEEGGKLKCLFPDSEALRVEESFEDLKRAAINKLDSSQYK